MLYRIKRYFRFALYKHTLRNLLESALKHRDVYKRKHINPSINTATFDAIIEELYKEAYAHNVRLNYVPETLES